MNHLRHLLKMTAALKISASPILQGHHRMLQYILLRLCCIFLGAVSINHTVLAKDAANAVTKISAEDAFLQGQQYLEQTNIPLAELSLTRIPSASPYAKLLAGNIATQKAEFDRVFLLLLPLQSNQSMSNSATASLHASLSMAYEKQGDIMNALDQLMRRESYLKEASTINANHQRVWQLLTQLSLQDLIALRGESTDTTTQGWVDLCLATKNQNIASNINAWMASYPDHVAADFSKTLSTQVQSQKNSQDQNTYTLPSSGSIALILPPKEDPLSPRVSAFHDGLQAALTKYALSNTVKTYPTLDNAESIAEQVNLAKSEGATYFITPHLNHIANEPPNEANADKSTITWLDTTETNHSLQSADLSINDEVQTIIAFLTSNAMQHITVISTNDDAATQRVQNLQQAWKNVHGDDVRVITLVQNMQSSDPNLLDLKAKIAEQATDILILSASAEDAHTIRPYLDISTPILGFSSVNEARDNNALNAVRFVDIPFLTNTSDTKFSDYRNQSAHISTNELLRYFALGVDYLQLLIAGTQAEKTEVIIDGLTGKLSLNKAGEINRQLFIAKFTYNGIMQDQ